MNLYKKTAVTIAILTLVISANISAIHASPLEAERMLNSSFQRGSDRDILETFEEGDYEKWKKKVGLNSRIASIVTKEKFNDFIKARRLAREGKYEEAIRLADELKKEIKRSL